MPELFKSAGMKVLRFAQLILLLWGMPFLAGAPQKTISEIVDYIRQAQRLGLKDDKIRQNALSAGWEKTQVEEAFTVARYLAANGVGAAPGASDGDSDPNEYRIGAGDVLQIVVWKEPEASVPNVVVRPDGKITVPMIKEIDVVGLTPNELQKLLAEKLQKFVRDADVTVVAKEIHSLKANLIGAVRKEGPVMLRRNMTVLQAINESGGFNEYAKRRKIYVLRNENGKQIRLPFDYEAVIAGKNMDQNIVLRANDMIVMPQ
jgi:polysaccharide export outer membrane protein